MRRRALRRGHSMALFSACLATLIPVIASACPVCAGRSDAAPWRGLLLALFIFFPFALVYGVIRFIRSQAQGDDAIP